MKSTVVGNYPKISSDKSAPNLRNALNAFDGKKISPADLEQVYQSTIRRVMAEQEQADLDIITDGQIRWDDLVTPLAKNISGFEIGGLIRFFNNNVYYRRPVVKSALKFKHSATVEQFKFAQSVSSKPVKVSLPGPFTFAALSLDEYYKNQEKLVMDLAEILHQEILELEKEGCKHIQLDEPFLSGQPERFELAQSGIQTVLKGIKAHKTLFFYFGRVDKFLPKLSLDSVDAVGIDLVSHKENLDALLKFEAGKKEVVLGCLDAR
ncbi:MAG: methylcobamide--CoM methyltransferase, partial [candidate division Zixibacteria bacterium]|nr:methylcobamide--CoM methyltransferase [candidate division Zixibacteria bacterium]